MEKSTRAEEATSTSHSNGRKWCRHKKLHREEDRSEEHSAVQWQDHLTNSLPSREVQSEPSISLTGLPHPPKVKSTASYNNNNNHFEASHFRTNTPSQSETSTKLPKHLYYQPQEDQETYTINAEGHLQCNQDSNKVIQVTTPQDLPGSREYPIFHKPGSIAINSVEFLITLYPNSFDRLGSLKGEYDIKVDATVPPVQHARRKVPIDSKAAIKEAIDYMVSEGILEPQIEPTPWVSYVTSPVKPLGEVRPCLDVRDLNKAIIHENHKPQAVEELLISWLEWWYSQRQMPWRHSCKYIWQKKAPSY